MLLCAILLDTLGRTFIILHVFKREEKFGELEMVAIRISEDKWIP
jgi:hypothetical protein